MTKIYFTCLLFFVTQMFAPQIASASDDILPEIVVSAVFRQTNELETASSNQRDD